MSKNIETCKSEEVLASVTEQQPQDYPSVQQAVHDLGVTALPAASAADPDIEELPSNVEVFVRRVLKAVVYDRVLPVVQQMWQAVLNRISSPNYTPYSLYPYASNPSLRTLGTLPTALSALSSRKISNGGATDDGIKDGVSLAHILGDSSVVVTKLEDDNKGWTLSRNVSTIINNYFPSATKVKLLCSKLTANTLFDNVQTAELEVPELTSLNNESDNHNVIVLRNCANVEEFSAPIKVLGAGTAISGNSSLRVLRLPNCDYIGGWSYDVPITNNANLEEAYLNSYTPSANSALANPISNCPKLWKVVFGVVRSLNAWNNPSPNFVSSDCTKIRDLEIGGAIVSFSLANWTPDAETIAHQDFLPNFLHHIAERLAVGPTTNRLTLTLSADVYSACGFGATIDDPTDIRYQIKKAIQDRNWKVTDGTNNFNQ